MAAVTIAFLFSTTPPQKKKTVRCRHCLLLLKHKEEGDDTAVCYHRLLLLLKHEEEGDDTTTYYCHLFHYNRTIEKDDDGLPSSSSSQT